MFFSWSKMIAKIVKKRIVRLDHRRPVTGR